MGHFLLADAFGVRTRWFLLRRIRVRRISLANCVERGAFDVLLTLEGIHPCESDGLGIRRTYQ